jgi:hypothetical protein
MASTNPDLVIGVFDHVDQAERAIHDLWQAGFDHDRIDMATRSQGVTTGTPRFALQKAAADGALAGAATGAGAGALAGALAALLVPGLGMVIGGGLLITVLGGAALGAAGGTFLGPFVALSMSEEDARHYSTQIEEGRTVVLVHTYDRQAEARAILARLGARERLAPASGPG